MAKTTEKSIEYYKRKAELAEQRLAEAERENAENYKRMEALVNDFSQRFGGGKLYAGFGAHNLYVVLSDICRTHGKGELNYPKESTDANS